MDGTRFDRLTRAFARVGTRRQVVAGAAAVAVSVGGLEAAEAATRCRAGRQTCQRDGQCCSGICRRGAYVPLKDRNRCACGDSETQCGNACVDLAHDERHCGVCGARCPQGAACCDGACIDVASDDANCGACGVVCEAGTVCCNGGCVDLDTDSAHCGACGNVCTFGGSCDAGICDLRDACRAVFDEDWGVCFFSTEGEIFSRHSFTGLELRGRFIECERDAECQEHPLCDLATNTCICRAGLVWGVGPDERGLDDPRLCFSMYRQTDCSDFDPASGYARCYANVEGDGWNAYNQAYATLNVRCTSSDECQGLDPRCDDPGYRCGCIYAVANGTGDMTRPVRTYCVIDNTLPM